MLLRFRAVNHRSLRDAVELSLVSPSMRGTHPPDQDWRQATTRVAGIYGANASGKSTVLHAIDFAKTAVAHSATRWGDQDGFPHQPFMLDRESRNLPSSYEFDFVAAGSRYIYGFESEPNGIREEWLYSYPAGRRRVLFERTRDAKAIKFGRSLVGENATISKLVRPNALFLSVAANNNHPVLSGIQQELCKGLDYISLDSPNSVARLRRAVSMLEEGDLLDQAGSLLRFADLGITDVTIESTEHEDRTAELITRLQHSLPHLSEQSPDLSHWRIIAAGDRQLRFGHRAGVDDSFSLRAEEESSGTVAWLGLGVHALRVLHDGRALIIDEIDSSLHPTLTAALISMFKDSEINRSGAQLVFTSHDTTLLGSLVGEVLSPAEVWFAEKSPIGVTELYSLQEFPTRETDNFERRYLQGRYGAVPIIDPAQLRAALAEDV
ncbi:AAA family ATPase [Actinoalloteichus fjordicus]|uniref:AAA domain n=1 Tax=Actinoalloteichus fjordicus TaxID=1612552 RepID=A0AAC9LJB5_9PSEU|nr:ATP-binding protein [Actinoalloteichus fjordicus]APU17354.1 AAA domain [Actinoalloteichus fjordicus]